LKYSVTNSVAFDWTKTPGTAINASRIAQNEVVILISERAIALTDKTRRHRSKDRDVRKFA
jgi:hypothetical protein